MPIIAQVSNVAHSLLFFYVMYRGNKTAIEIKTKCDLLKYVRKSKKKIHHQGGQQRLENN